MKFKKFSTNKVTEFKDAGYNTFTGSKWVRLYTDGEALYEVHNGCAYRVAQAAVVDSRDPMFETVEVTEATEWGGR